ncbi:ATP-dependent DNA helicase [Hyphococcus sp.]|uniref:ATP-dependent DNA helicase n=1 Tax=Hyphococcus sp. TaxID=2038636 RepID=UPI0035C71E68
MPTHITARLAWHDDGWNGAICKRPALNSYCVGAKSYPGDTIARSRDLTKEQCYAGCGGKQLEGNYVPPCCYSYNAFGIEEAPAASDPPNFFYGGAARHEWALPPATVCVWPYDAMYDDNVKVKGYLDNDQRRENTLPFFAEIECGDASRSLIFYYANYSNPFSEEEAQRYVLIGVSRVIDVGDELFYEDVNEKISDRYAGGIIWARNVTSAYPSEGVRLPYHLYRDDPDKMQKLALYPENPLLCKMGSKHLTDDEAIGLLEQFLGKVRWLQEIEDTSENWAARANWISKQIATLWKERGIYPGLLQVLEACGASPLIAAAKGVCETQGHDEAHKLAFEVLDTGRYDQLPLMLSATEKKRLARNWALLEDGVRKLLRDVLVRFDLGVERIKKVIAESRSENGLTASTEMIAENPYILNEQYCGDDAGDRIPWSLIDRGVLPSPELGPPLCEMDNNDARRFRGLCVDHLSAEPNHNFRFAADLLAEITERMDHLPEWKQAGFSDRYFDVDAEFISGAIAQKSTEHGRVLYLRRVFEDERFVEKTLRDLAGRPDIQLKRPVLEDDWRSWVFKSDSDLAEKAADEYETAVVEQANICASLLPRPLAAVTGPAGTGKTTVIEALIRGIRKTEGDGANILVLAPTGKATDRVRETFEVAKLNRVETSTVHSLLAKNGWLNPNMTFRQERGQRAEIATLIVDEASMLDLELVATLFRAIDWKQLRRLVLVGDPAQLPPIGRGRVFADILEWLDERQEGIGRLRTNLRQLLTRAQGRGEGIVGLSTLFVRCGTGRIELVDENDASSDGATTLEQESLIEKLHVGGEIDKDLDVIYWDDPTQLSSILISAVESKMGRAVDDERRPYQIWQSALENDPTTYQILSPHRGELHGVEAINSACQQRLAAGVLARIGAVDGITAFDKVIQIRNRPRSRMIWAYDWDDRALKEIEIFNGEIGRVELMGFDRSVQKRLKSGFGETLKRFSVRFSRKANLAVGYGKGTPALTNSGKQVYRSESVDENLELAYAVSVHKAQGSEFANTFVIIPASRSRSLSSELVYTAITRASKHCTLLIERDVSSLLDARRRENARTPQINSSLFEFRFAPPELINRKSWYESGKIHEALSGDMVRSKSEIIIANMLHEQGVPFSYELPLLAPDGTIKLPDFTITWDGERYFWEHLGMLGDPEYARRWEEKKGWYDKWFPNQLVSTCEGRHLSNDVQAVIQRLKNQLN